jgi:hypothetical protein
MIQNQKVVNLINCTQTGTKMNNEKKQVELWEFKRLKRKQFYRMLEAFDNLWFGSVDMPGIHLSKAYDEIKKAEKIFKEWWRDV